MKEPAIFSGAKATAGVRGPGITTRVGRTTIIRLYPARIASSKSDRIGASRSVAPEDRW